MSSAAFESILKRRSLEQGEPETEARVENTASVERGNTEKIAEDISRALYSKAPSHKSGTVTVTLFGLLQNHHGNHTKGLLKKYYC